MSTGRHHYIACLFYHLHNFDTRTFKDASHDTDVVLLDLYWKKIKYFSI